MTNITPLRVLLVCWLCCWSAEGVKMARLSDGDTTITSSTLAWVPAGGSLPAYAVAVAPNLDNVGPFWCRGHLRGFQLPGTTTSEGPCRVPFLSSIELLFRYDILVSLNGLARLHHQAWDKFTSKPDHAVVTPDRMLVLAQSDASPDGPLLPGSLGLRMRDRNAHVIDGDIVRKVGKAKILVEEETASYSLHHVVLNGNKQKITNSTLRLKKFNLTNPSDQPATITKDVDYEVRDRQYWGRVKGTVTALKVDVKSPNDPPVPMPFPHTTLSLQWGMDNLLGRVDTKTITHELPAGAGVEAELEGVMWHYEAPYTATLTARYSDGATRDRPINSRHTHQTLASVIAKYTRYYNLTGSDLPIPPSYSVEGAEETSDGGGQPSSAITIRPSDRVLSALASLFTNLMLRYYAML